MCHCPLDVINSQLDIVKQLIVTNKVVKFNGTQLDDANITDTGSLITLGSNTVVSGELEATSLDINGNADISGNLTGVDAFTASGKIQGAELEGTSLDINGAADIAGNLQITQNAATLNLVGTDHSYIQWYPDGISGGRKAYTGYAGGTDDNFSIVNEISGANVKINTNGGAIELLDNTVVSGELEATSLDINGNADISGDLTVDNITSTSNGGDASIYINSTRPTLGFTDTNSFTFWMSKSLIL